MTRLYGRLHHDYRYCPKGGRHDWTFNGGQVVNRVGTLINDQRCTKCDRRRTVYSHTGRRYIR